MTVIAILNQKGGSGKTTIATNLAHAIELPIFNNGTAQRVIYPTTASHGQTVFTEPNSPAAKEITAIAEELMEFIA